MLPRFPAYFWLCSAISLPVLARAAEEKPFGAADADAPVRSISQREFADAATAQIGFLSELRAWRNTLRGSGTQRKWAVSPLAGQKLALSLGNVAPQTLGGGAGIAAKWKGLELGSTAQPESLDEALKRFDSLLTGEKSQNLQNGNKTQLNWLRAQLSDSPRAQIEILAARATRVLPDASRKWRGVDFGSARARFQLPAKWSLSGDFNRAEVERAAASSKNGENDTEISASAWSLAASGPITHPFGVASASASWQSVGDGYLAPTSENGAVGAQNGSLEVGQDLKIGPLSGNLHFGAATRRAEGEARAGQQMGQDHARSAAQMRLALTPNLSVTGNGQWNTSAATRALIDADKIDQTTEIEQISPVQARELSRQLAGDVGLQWNFSKALSLAASLGVSSQDSRSQFGEIFNPGPQSEELRRALEVRQKSGVNDLRVRFSQRARRNAIATSNLSKNAALSGSAEGEPVSQWRIEAARPLLGNVRLKTILDFASDAATDQSARRFETQLQLARAARLDARYREGNLALGLLSDEWSSVFAGSNSALKQMSARFGVGSAAAGAGLGLSLEMVKNQGTVPDSYRVGVQFK